MVRLKALMPAVLVSSLLLLTGCAATPSPDVSSQAETGTAAGSDGSTQVATADETVTPVDVVEEGMEPVYASALNDGTYDVVVDSSSSMFKVVSCKLTVADGAMSATMTMGGTGYRWVYLGTGEQAVAASEGDYIAYVEDADGAHTFTVPVEALDEGIDCAAFSKKKEKWYDRTLLFRADSLPQDAFADAAAATVASLGLTDGSYTVEVALAGGSGRAAVASPAELTVADGAATATIVWGSSNYDYMRIGDEKYLPVNTEGNSTFELPVASFDRALAVAADTTAMSTPHEIDYTLTFDASTIEKA